MVSEPPSWILWCAALKQSCLLGCHLQPLLWAAPLPPPWLQYIKDQCLAATTASASSIRPQITPSESKLSDLPFCEISSSSDLPRASTRNQNSRRHWHAPSRAANTAHAPSCTSRIRHAPTRACTRQGSLLTSALGDVICHVIRHVICWRHPPHLVQVGDLACTQSRIRLGPILMG